jgi:hypothetical protein
VNARDNTPLRTLIADRLAAGEDTAAGIAKAIGKGDTPSIVVKELNAMRTDGQVECEQRGKKKELVYWLAVPLDVAAASVEPAPSLPPATISEVMLPPGVRHGTRAAQIYRVLPLYGAKPMTARQIATATGAALGLISPTLSGMVKAGQISRVLTDPCDAYGYTRLPPAGGDIDIQNAQPEVAKNTGSSASGYLSPSEGAAVQSKPAPVAAATPSAAPVAADVQPQSAEIPPQVTPQIPPPQYDPNEVAFRAPDPLAQIRDLLLPLVCIGDTSHMPDALQIARSIPGLIAGLRRDIANRDAALEQMDAQVVSASETLAPLVLGDTDTSDMGLQEIAEKVAAVVNAHDDELLAQAKTIIDLRNQLGEECTARQSLQEQIEHLQREAMRGDTCLSGQDRYTAAGYLVRASKRKPRTLLSEDKAREAAMSSIRTGAPWAAVYALVPIGCARRGVEWRSA